MSQLEVSKAEAAEERSEQTRSFVRTVKAAARRKYTPKRRSELFWRASAARSQSTTCAGGRGSSPTPTTRGPKSSWRRARRG